MAKHPLGEVFGYPADNITPEAVHDRNNTLCPFHERRIKCTKDKDNDPLGVCSIHEGGDLAVVCPGRFREGGIIIHQTAEFFFPPDSIVVPLYEIRLKDISGKAVGNIDIVLASVDADGNILDFGAVEIQSVYVSGNIRNSYKSYMDSIDKFAYEFKKGYNYPKADYLSSSRKRLIPQIISKGAILNHWGKKTAIVLHTKFYATIEYLFNPVAESDSDLAWFIYDLQLNVEENKYHLVLDKVVYTKYEEVLSTLVTPKPGDIDDFVSQLQTKYSKVRGV